MDRRPHPITVVRRIVDAALVVLVALVLIGVGLGRGVPLTGRQTLIIGGPSMEPAIPMGSAAIIEPLGGSGPAVGDVVTVRVGPASSFVTHRVVRLLSLAGVPYIETKGDANPTPDGATVPASAVVGRLAWSIPFAGYLLALLSVPIGILFVLALGMTLLLVAFLLDTFDPREQLVAGSASPGFTPVSTSAPDRVPDGGAVALPAADATPSAAAAPTAQIVAEARADRRSVDRSPLEGRVARHLANRPPRTRRRRPA